MITVLFTSAGRRVELIRAFRSAFQRLGLDGRIVAADIDPLAPTFQVADQTYLVPRLTSPDYVSSLVEICRRDHVDLVFPLIDPDVPVLAAARPELEAAGATCAVVPLKACEIVGDKWLTAAFFERRGVPTARSWLPDEVPRDAQFPLFLKPRRGSAAQHTFKIRDRRELDFFAAYVHDPIVQEFLPGPEITIDVTCGLDGEVLAVVCRQRIEVRSGEVAKGVTVARDDLMDAAVRIARGLPAIGPITVQCILRDDQPYFTEINARFGGGVPLGIAAGVDSPALVLARHLGIPFDHPAIGDYTAGLYMSRFDDSFMISETRYRELARRRF